MTMVASAEGSVARVSRQIPASRASNSSPSHAGSTWRSSSP